jgi:hypothetical protein
MESNCGQRLRLPPTAKTRKPNTQFALLVFDLYKRRKLTEAKLRGLYDKLYKLAVITGEEDQQINDAGLRAKMLSSPEERWLKAGIKIVSVA